MSVAEEAAANLLVAERNRWLEVLVEEGFPGDEVCVREMAEVLVRNELIGFSDLRRVGHPSK